jgi:hypothetical protein
MPPRANAEPGASEMITILARVFARLAIAMSHSTGAASFRQIAVLELKIASDEEATAIEAWLTAHPGGGHA